MNGLSQLRQLALTDSRQRRPDYPESARYVKPYSDRTANALTRAILDYCKLNGHFAERTGCTGRYIDSSRVVSDILDRQMRIGTGKWIPASGTKGTSDLKLLINGIPIACEIKMPGDRMRPNQVKYKKEYEQAGGRFWICRSFQEFLNQYNELNNGCT